MKTNRVIIAALAVVYLACAGTRAGAAAPEFTPGQKIEAREGDTWSEATFVKKEGRRLNVRYADGTEEWVTADRVRAAPASPNVAPAAPGAAPVTLTLQGPFTQIHLSPPQPGPAKRANVLLNTKPTTRPAAAFTDLTPSSGTGVGRPVDLLVCPDTPNIVVAVGHEQSDNTSLLCIDTSNPQATVTHVLNAHEEKVVGVAAGGAALLTQSHSNPLALHLWELHDERYQLKGNYTFIEAEKNKSPHWARLLSPTRLLMRDDSGEAHLIDLPTRRQLYSVKCDNLSIHPSGQYVLATVADSNVLMRPNDLAIIAQMPGEHSPFVLDGTGTLAAAESAGTTKVVKVVNGAVLQTARGMGRRNRIELLGPSELLVDGKTFYDLKTNIPVWDYKTEGCESELLSNGQMLYVGSIDGQELAVMATLPDDEAMHALTAATPEKFSLIPGTHIAIAGDLSPFGDANQAHAEVEKSLTAAGHKADAAATDFKLTITAVAGPTGKIGVREFHTTTGPLVREVDAPSTIVTYVLTHNGQTIWKKEMKFNAAVVIRRRQDQSLEQAVAEAGKPTMQSLSFIGLPGYIVRGGENGRVVTLGQSSLTRTGFKPVPAAGN